MKRHWTRLQHDGDNSFVSHAVPEHGQVGLKEAPAAAYKIRTKHNQGLLAALDALDHIVYDGLPWKKVPLMIADPQAGEGLLQFVDKTIDPDGVSATIADEYMVLVTLGQHRDREIQRIVWAPHGFHAASF
ncbi:hypothetical protein FKM82_026060 [Ascaphus truei]